MDWLVQGFAVVTLASNAVVLAGGGLDALGLLLALLALGFGVIAWRWRAALPRAGGASTDDAPLYVDAQAQGPLPAALSIPFALAALAAVVALQTSGGNATYTAIGALACLAMTALTFHSRPALATPRPELHARTVVAALCALCAAAVLFTQRSDADDAFYLNLVVAAIDEPGRALLSVDTLHGLPGVSMSLPVFQVLSYEMFEAVVARGLGLDALTLVHVVMPPLVALLIPLAYARLLGVLLPDRWLEALVVVVLLLLFIGNGDAGYADFALLRLHQGKSVLLHVALPLVTSYAIEFAVTPSASRWLRLAAAQIAAVGLSSTALWLAPLCAGIGVAAGLPLRRGGDGRGGFAAALQIVGLGLLTCAHPIAWALGLRASTTRAFEEALNRIDSLDWTGTRLVEHASHVVLGDGLFEAIALFSWLAVLGLAPTLLLRRFAAVSGLVVFGLLWNPLTAHFVANSIAGPDTYFRVLWAAPVPLFVAAVLTTPLTRIGTAVPGPRARRLVPGAIAVVVLLGLVADPFTLGAGNGVRVATPGPRIAPDEYAAAREITLLAQRRSQVLAPARVSRWIPLFHQHPYPLMIREMHLDLLHPHVGLEEVERRRTLTRLVGGDIHTGDAERLLADAIRDYPLDVVCIGGAARNRPTLRRALLESPLVSRSRTAEYEIWSRASPVEAPH